MYLRIDYFVNFLSLHSVCATVTRVTNWWVKKFVDIIGSTVFHRNLFEVLAIGVTKFKADRSFDFTVFYLRMSALQPPWPVCSTSESWHGRCWHFCSCSSHKTIPSLREFVVAKYWTILRCFVTALSFGITQVFVIIARIDYKVKWRCQLALILAVYQLVNHLTAFYQTILNNDNEIFLLITILRILPHCDWSHLKKIVKDLIFLLCRMPRRWIWTLPT